MQSHVKSYHILSCLSPRFLQSTVWNIIAPKWHLKGPPHQSDTPPLLIPVAAMGKCKWIMNLINSKWMTSFINYSWEKLEFNDTGSSTLKYAGVEKQIAQNPILSSFLLMAKHILSKKAALELLYAQNHTVSTTAESRLFESFVCKLGTAADLPLCNQWSCKHDTILWQQKVEVKICVLHMQSANKDWQKWCTWNGTYLTFL